MLIISMSEIHGLVLFLEVEAKQLGKGSSAESILDITRTTERESSQPTSSNKHSPGCVLLLCINYPMDKLTIYGTLCPEPSLFLREQSQAVPTASTTASGHYPQLYTSTSSVTRRRSVFPHNFPVSPMWFMYAKLSVYSSSYVVR